MTGCWIGVHYEVIVGCVQWKEVIVGDPEGLNERGVIFDVFCVRLQCRVEVLRVDGPRIQEEDQQRQRNDQPQEAAAAAQSYSIGHEFVAI